MQFIWRHYHFNNAWDISWTICFHLCLMILIFGLIAFIKTMQHIHCIPTSAEEGFRFKFESKRFKSYSTLSVLLATISAILIFITFPVCSQWQCLETMLGFVYSILWWDSYTLSKIFIYLIFTERLFDSLYIGIYRYPRCIQYALWMLLSALVIVMIANNITVALVFFRIEYPLYFIDAGILAVYGTTDCTLSISLVILFFRPIWRRNQVSIRNRMSVVRKYAALSGVQLLVTLSYQIALVVTNLLWWKGASMETIKAYGDIRNVFQMLDCLLLIMCIYLGFARQETVCYVHSVHLSVG